MHVMITNCSKVCSCVNIRPAVSGSAHVHVHVLLFSRSDGSCCFIQYTVQCPGMNTSCQLQGLKPSSLRGPRSRGLYSLRSTHSASIFSTACCWAVFTPYLMVHNTNRCHNPSLRGRQCGQTRNRGQCRHCPWVGQQQWPPTPWVCIGSIHKQLLAALQLLWQLRWWWCRSRLLCCLLLQQAGQQ
jgi:hypothetical protein